MLTSNIVGGWHKCWYQRANLSISDNFTQTVSRIYKLFITKISRQCPDWFELPGNSVMYRITLYKHGSQKSISICTKHQSGWASMAEDSIGLHSFQSKIGYHRFFFFFFLISIFIKNVHDLITIIPPLSYWQKSSWVSGSVLLAPCSAHAICMLKVKPEMLYCPTELYSVKQVNVVFVRSDQPVWPFPINLSH